jgi:hypothetical protein
VVFAVLLYLVFTKSKDWSVGTTTINLTTLGVDAAMVVVFFAMINGPQIERQVDGDEEVLDDARGNTAVGNMWSGDFNLNSLANDVQVTSRHIPVPEGDLMPRQEINSAREWKYRAR